MPVDQPRETGARKPTEKWRQLPKRISPDEMVESVSAEDPPPSSAEPAGDPDTAWMLRYS